MTKDCGDFCCGGEEEKMTTGEQDTVHQYQPPSRDYLVAMLNSMRDASARAQQAFFAYHGGKARIEAEVRGEGLERGYTEELMQRLYSERSQKDMAWLVDEYTYWREKAMWHAATLTAENLTLDALWDLTAPSREADVPVLQRETVDEAKENDRCGACGSTEHFREDCPTLVPELPDEAKHVEADQDRCPQCKSRRKELRRKDKGVRCDNVWHDSDSVEAWLDTPADEAHEASYAHQEI